MPQYQYFQYYFSLQIHVSLRYYKQRKSLHPNLPSQRVQIAILERKTQPPLFKKQQQQHTYRFPLSCYLYQGNLVSWEDAEIHKMFVKPSLNGTMRSRLPRGHNGLQPQADLLWHSLTKNLRTKKYFILINGMVT